jgi:RHS repeat-associated protein
MAQVHSLAGRPHATHSFRMRATCSVLAVLAFWGPLAPRRAHAQEVDAQSVRGRLVSPHVDESIEETADTDVREELKDEERALSSDKLEAAAELADGEPRPAETADEEGADEQPLDDEAANPLTLPAGPDKSAATPQAIALPKGEGSIQGMGESFTPDLSSGTGTFAVPIVLPKGRNGVGPSLTLSYSTAGGNGVIGQGWSIGVPFISRQTDKGLPSYRDAARWHAEEDTFMYNGGQELVPVDSAAATRVDGAPVPAELQGWQQYRARIEGAFMRFFRAPDSQRWIVQGKDGVRYEFGAFPGESLEGAVQVDPEDAQRVFSWQLVRTSDAHGSAVQYRYIEEGGKPYLSEIYYDMPARCGVPLDAVATRSCSAPLSEYGRRVRLVYQQRPDATTSFLTSWRVDARLRLARIEVTSTLGEVGERFLVRRYHLSYESSSYHSLLASLQVEGRPNPYRSDIGVHVGTHVRESDLTARIVGEVMPPMRFTYSAPDATTETIPGFGGLDGSILESSSSPNHSLDEGRSDLFDVNSDGLPDVLVTDPARFSGGAGVYFNGFAGGRPTQAGEFSSAVHVAVPPGLSGTLDLSRASIVPMDIDGDGKSDLLHMPRRANYGYFVTSKEPARDGFEPLAGWSFAHVPTTLPAGQTDPRIDLTQSSELFETADVNNDHLIDILKTTGQKVQVWLNLGQVPGGDGRFGSATFDGRSHRLSTAPIETCLPSSGLPVDFSSSDTRLADMNGDGLLDIVRMRAGDVLYWPGRGTGAFGDGSAACTEANRATRHVRMGSPPQDLGSVPDEIHLVDVNEDGATDLLRVDADNLSVWFNRGGASFTERLLVDPAPLQAGVLGRVRVTDIDGSGTTDVVYGQARNYRWIDLMGGRRPRLLERVDNGLGALTTFEYESSIQDYLRDLSEARSCNPNDLECFTWQREPLLPGQTQAKCDARALERGGVCVHRGGGSSVASTVVRAVTTSDRLDVLGARAQQARTEYRYHDGYYEGIEQEFRGFGAADAIVLGDAHEPASHVRTFFHQGRRPNEIAGDRLADNPNEALKGLQYLSEAFDAHGTYLSTTHATYAVRSLFTGLNGVTVRYAFVRRSDEYRYDTSPFTAGGGQASLASVERQVAGAGSSTSTVTTAEPGDAPHVIEVRSARYAHILSTVDRVDNIGHVLEKTAHGRNGEGGAADESIVQHNVPVRLEMDCSGSGWLWRTAESWLSGHGAGSQKLKHSVNDYTACGDVRRVRTYADLPTGLSLSFAGSGSALGYTQSSQVLESTSRNDAWGQATEMCQGGDLALGSSSCLRYGALRYDAAYNTFIDQESLATSRAGDTLSFLRTTASWDEGLGVLESRVDPNGLTSEVYYDGLGRLTATILPNVADCAGSRVPTTRIFYNLTHDPAARPLSRVHTITELDCRRMGEDMLETFAYVDGLGRPRAMLSEGDDDPEVWVDDRPHNWLRTGIKRLSAKGQPVESWVPTFFEGTPDSYASVVVEPDAPHAGLRYDAFGRPTIAIAEDGSHRITRYHALSRDSVDSIDDGQDETAPGCFRGTYTTEHLDGHGRVIQQHRRQVSGNCSRPEHHHLFSYYRADGALMRLVRALGDETTTRPESAGHAGLTAWVERTFVYDSVRRRLSSTDPNTDDRSAPASARSWRYLFNRAGDLAALRDPRGCGQNFFYDMAGRLIGEQYVACGEAQRAGEATVGSVPAGSMGHEPLTADAAVHVLYHFDAYPSWATVALSEAPDHDAVAGRATGSTDRAQRNVVVYDERGHAIWGAKQMAVLPRAATFMASGPQSGHKPSFVEGTEAPALSAFDEAQTYFQRASFDHAGRNKTSELPSDPDFEDGDAPRVGGELFYTKSGSIRGASLEIDDNSYPVVARMRFRADGLVAQTVYGDGQQTGRASTVTETLYDSRRRPEYVRTTRAAAEGASARTLSGVSDIVAQRLHWDRESNLIAIEDERPGAEWPAGHLPQTVHISHDALYRVEGVFYEYRDADGETVDSATDWRDTEARHHAADPMRATAAPRLADAPGTRVVDLTYRHDWLANLVEWHDDGPVFYERSLGAITNGADTGQSPATTASRPGALYLASNLGGDHPGRRGWLEVDYGVSGNVTGMTVHAQCTDTAADSCADPGGNDLQSRLDALRTGCACAAEQHYSYRYDEVNRLSEARRFDRAAPGPWTLKVRQRYRYDALNQRTIKHTFDVASSDSRATLYVLPGNFERRGLRVGDERYTAIEGETETQYLVAGARVVWQGHDGLHPGELDADHRITVALSDLIGSTSAVIDLMSGELLEVTGFYPNGAREHWLDASAADARSFPLEPVGFTGKEGDEEVGLAYFGERYLIPRIGRWATPDPLHIHALGGGEALNPYHYVAGDLLQTRDPLGLEPADGEEQPNPWDAARMYGRAIAGAVEATQDASVEDNMIASYTNNPEMWELESMGWAYREEMADGRVRWVVDPDAMLSLYRDIDNKQIKAWVDKGYRDAKAEQVFWKVSDAVDAVETATGVGSLLAGASRLGKVLIRRALRESILEGLEHTMKRLTRAICSFPAGTPVATATGYAAIEAIEVGDWVTVPGEQCAPDSVDGWLRVTLKHVDEESGAVTDIELLRPREAVEAAGFTIGAVVAVDLYELNARALVVDIQPEPARSGVGCPVTGTFHHQAADFVSVWMDGDDSPLQVTAIHPFYSVDRGWVMASMLEPGEPIQGRDRIWRVLAVASDDEGERPAFNLEVAQAHSYFVDDSALLVHNDCKPGLKEFDIERYGSFNIPSRSGDGLAGHEVLQNAWLEANRGAQRGKGAMSRNNPAVALTDDLHDAVTAEQRALGLLDKNRLRGMSAADNIALNAEAMRRAEVPEHVIQAITKEATDYAASLSP